VLAVLIVLTPAIAQGLTKSPVVLDGQELFQVSANEDLTASDRARIINTQLQELIKSQEPLQVEVIDRKHNPTILINNSYLMTVTEADVAPGNTPSLQARIWSQQLQDQLLQAQESRNPTHIRQNLLIALAVLLVTLVLYWGLGWFWQHSLRPALRQLLPATADGESIRPPRAFNLLLAGLLAIARGGLLLGVVFYITNLFPMTRQWGYYVASLLITSLTAPILILGKSQYSVTNLVILGIMLLGLVIVSKATTDMLRSRILQRTGVNRGAQEVVTILLRYSLLFIGSLVLLQIWGLDISSLTILASALSVGIGFGLQDIAKNFGSGLVLVFERPIQVGDFVEVGEFQGTVERIGARSTLIRTLDQVSIIVPNSRFLEQEVINWSHDNPISRIHLPIGVAYSSDVAVVRSVLLDSAKGHARVLSTPAPQVFFKGFGDSSLDFELLVWTAEPSKQLPLKSDLYFRIEELLRQHQIEVPFPQRDLYIRAERLPIEFSPQIEQALQRLVNPQTNGKSAPDSGSS
ncbi:MAG TPA: mechanosensitive ion channel domain-containing protein, partial [Crinalium sp.]